MVLESNRDLVLRRLVECLGRDRTRHQVAEVTSLGLVQMTRKRIGTGLIEAFSETCEHCQGRGLIMHEQPVEGQRAEDEGRRGRRSRGGRSGRGSGESGNGNGGQAAKSGPPSPKDVAAMARPPADQADDFDASDDSDDSEAELEALSSAEDTPEQVPAAEPPEEPTRVKPVETTAVEAPSEPEPDPEPEPAAEPEKPTVVTRTRRRSASRPAGPPVAAGAAVPAMDGAPASLGADADGLVGSVSVNGVVEPGTVDAEPGTSAPHVEHVPIKRKGSRKR